MCTPRMYKSTILGTMDMHGSKWAVLSGVDVKAKMKNQSGIERGVRVGDRKALTLHHIDAIRQDGEQEVGYAIIQQVDLIHVQDAPVRLC